MLRDAVSDLQACVDSPFSCKSSYSDFLNIINNAAQLAPNRQVLDLLAQGLLNGVGGCVGGGGTDPFCQFSVNVVDAMRHHASTNPDAAIIYWLQFIDALFNSGDALLYQEGREDGDYTMSHLFSGILENLPKAINPASLSRTMLTLQTLADMPSLPVTGSEARIFLNELKTQGASGTANTVPITVTPTKSWSTTFWIIGSVIAAGAVGVTVWALAARRRRAR